MKVKIALVSAGVMLLVTCIVHAQAAETVASRAFEEIWSGHDGSKIATLYRDDVRFRINDAQPKQGLDSVKSALESTLSVFPDFTMKIDEMLLAGEKVVVRWTFRGTHKEYDKKVEFSGISILGISEGKITYENRIFDRMRANEQLGFTVSAPSARQQN